jgi:hypothetical protein
MGAAYQSRGASGAKLLSAYQRALIDIATANAPVIDLAPGVSSLSLIVPSGALVAAPNAPNWALARNRVHKFKAGLTLFANNPNLISLESCGFLANLNNPLNGGAPGAGLVKAANLAGLSALANASPITIDEFTIDSNDCINLGPQSGGVGALNRYSQFLLVILLTVNNTGAAHQNINVTGTVEVRIGDFDSYKFDSWE